MIRRTTAFAILVWLAAVGAVAGPVGAQACEVATCPSGRAGPPPPALTAPGPLPSGSAVVEGSPPGTDASASSGPLAATSGPTPNGAAAALGGTAIVGCMLALLTRLRRRRLAERAGAPVPAPHHIPSERPPEVVTQPAVLDGAGR